MDRYDTIIRQCLKQWVVRYAPPAEGRARLLRAAAATKHTPCALAILGGRKMRPFQSLEVPDDLFHWAIVYTLERGIAMKSLVS